MLSRPRLTYALLANTYGAFNFSMEQRSSNYEIYAWLSSLSATCPGNLAKPAKGFIAASNNREQTKFIVRADAFATKFFEASKILNQIIFHCNSALRQLGENKYCETYRLSYLLIWISADKIWKQISKKKKTVYSLKPRQIRRSFDCRKH